MKQLILFTFATLVCSGCNNQPESSSSINDSLIVIEQNKVTGTIQFGIGKNQFEIEKEKFMSDAKRNLRDYPALFSHFIGEYNFYDIQPTFYDDKLYEVDILGVSTDWELFYTEVPEQVKNISNVIRQKYGDPNVDNKLRPRNTYEKGYSYLLNKWVVGDKTIEIRLSDEGSVYTVNVYIYKPKVRQLIEKQNEDAKQKSTSNAKDIF